MTVYDPNATTFCLDMRAPRSSALVLAGMLFACGGSEATDDERGDDSASEDSTGGDPTGGDPTGGDPTGGDPTGGGSTSADSTSADSTGAPAEIDWSAVDERLDSFIAESPDYDGTSIVIVDRDQGIIHQAAFGTYTLETIVHLASVSKVPSAMVLMAAHEDPALDFDIAEPLETYLSWDGVWPGMTAEQLVSNTSGMPGLLNFAGYGAHLCAFDPSDTLLSCGQTIYETPLDGLPSNPPGTAFDYGGSPWQLSGALAEVVSGQSWAELLDQYIAGPCGLEVFEYGNMGGNFSAWDGTPASLIGQANALIEGGAISNLADYATLLQIHLNDGRCGDTQVLSPEAIEFMRIDRGSAVGSREFTFGDGPSGQGYGLGWWIVPRDESEPYLFIDPGLYGSVAWLDTDRGIGGLVLLSDYTSPHSNDGSAMVTGELIGLVEAALDSAP